MKVLTSRLEKVPPFPGGKLRQKLGAGLGMAQGTFFVPRTRSSDLKATIYNMCLRVTVRWCNGVKLDTEALNLLE